MLSKCNFFENWFLIVGTLSKCGMPGRFWQRCTPTTTPPHPSPAQRPISGHSSCLERSKHTGIQFMSTYRPRDIILKPISWIRVRGRMCWQDWEMSDTDQEFMEFKDSCAGNAKDALVQITLIFSTILVIFRFFKRLICSSQKRKRTMLRSENNRKKIDKDKPLSWENRHSY